MENEQNNFTPITIPNTYKWLPLWIMLFVVFLLGIAGIYLYRSNPPESQIIENTISGTPVSVPVPASTPSIPAIPVANTDTSPFNTFAPDSPSTPSFYPEVRTAFLKSKELLNGDTYEDPADLPIGNRFPIWWDEKDGLTIRSNNTSHIQLFGDCGAHKNFLPTSFEEVSQNLADEIDSIMTKNGFVMSEKNSTGPIVFDGGYDNVRSYESDTMKAKFVFNANCSTDTNNLVQPNSPNKDSFNISLSYTNNFVDDYNQQAPYLREAGIDGSIVIEKAGPEFALLSVDKKNTPQGVVIVKLINKKWTTVYSGPYTPDCASVKEYQIPKDIAPYCNTGEDLQGRQDQ